ncbi:siderophore-interacting protein [Streptomyces sp. NBC_00237]|uniref:siderophore-interacting protein n=1 Tax=Streptomyces sp. NBC_00237 TaxID=2975687 RepID=UPI00224DB37B|nr:siderophore-interacting protein [Streptomyces sp. NBC_00237]MCX5201106.1 siderophore-interacting protein [Streptomyces sp. NBC_00237]
MSDTTDTTIPFRLFHLSVLRTERLSPSLLRVTFGGHGPDGLTGFASGGRDQSLSLFLPQPGQEEPVLPPETDPDWFTSYRALPEGTRAVMRSYTARAHRTDPDELDIDFALHPDGGPACRWAEQAAPGHRVAVLGPAVADNAGVRFRPADDTDHVLIWADETALPAASAALEELPSDLPVRAWITVQHPDDAVELRAPAGAEITYLVRDENAPAPVDAIAAAEIPATGTPYVWIAGEASCVRALRRHFVNDRGHDRRRITFTGYWRQGLTEDGLRENPSEYEIS